MIIKEILVNSNQMEAFRALPDQLYPPGSPAHQQASQWEPNYLEKVIIVEEGGKVKARATLHFNPGLRFKNEPTLTIGHYQSADDQAGKELLQFAAKQARELGGKWLLGPMNGSTWNSYRFKDRPEVESIFLEPDHHADYPQQFRQVGFEAIAHYQTNSSSALTAPELEKLKQAETEWQAKGLRLRTFDKSREEEELKNFAQFTQKAFANNFLFTPLSEAAFLDKYSLLMPYLDSSYILIAERDTQLVGFVLGIPDLLNPGSNQLIIKTLARDPAETYRGLGNFLAAKLIQLAMEKNFARFFHALMISDNRSKELSEQQYLGEVYQTYTLYGLNLTD